jgi:hypothetical protein
MTRPVFAALIAALAIAAIAPASARTPTSAADLAGRWTSDTRDERGMEIRTEGARIAAVRIWHTDDGTVCTQNLSGTFDPARRSAALDQRSTCENGANGTGPACTLRVAASDRLVLACPDFNPRTFRRAAR